MALSPTWGHGEIEGRNLFGPRLFCLGVRLVSGCTSLFQSVSKLHARNLNRNVKGTGRLETRSQGLLQALEQDWAVSHPQSHLSGEQSSPLPTLGACSGDSTSGSSGGGLGARDPVRGSSAVGGAECVVPNLAARRRGAGPRAWSRSRCRRRIASVLELLERRVTMVLSAGAPSSCGGSLMPRFL